MKTILKMLVLAVFLFTCNTLFAKLSDEDSITQNFTDLGYTVTEIERSKVPGLNHFTVQATKDGEKYKFKIFDSSCFLSDDNGKLIRFEFGPSRRPMNRQYPDAFQRKPLRKRFETDKKSEAVETAGARPIPSLGILENAQPSIKLGSQSGRSGVRSSLDTCAPANFGSLRNLGRQMDVVATVLNHTEIIKVSDKTQEYERPEPESTTDKILQRQKPHDDNTLAESQRRLENSVNSPEMYDHAMRMFLGTLRSKTPPGMTPDQMTAYRSLERLSSSLLRQGKSKDEATSIVARQMKVLFKGNISLSGRDPDTKWTMHPEGRMTVYSLTNNRDQILNYAAQAMTFRNDPIYQSKRKAWVDSTREIDMLKNRTTFEDDNKRMIELEKRTETLSREIDIRQKELLS